MLPKLSNLDFRDQRLCSLKIVNPPEGRVPCGNVQVERKSLLSECLNGHRAQH